MSGRHWLFLVVIFGAAILGGAWWSLSPDSGDVEFEHAKEALKSVKTWKFSMVAPPNAKFYVEGSWEVDCAAGWHGMVHEVNSFDEGNPTDRTLELSHVGGTTYMRSGSEVWGPTNVDFLPEDPSSACASLPDGKPQYPFPDFAKLLNQSVITNKGTKRVNGVKCREWLVQVVKIMQRQDLTMCLGVKDHLPYEISYPNGSTLNFSDYNQPLQLERPR